MPVMQRDFAEVTQFVRSLRGGSQSIVVEASDGLYYVAKFTNNLQGPNLSFNESMGTELFRACGLSVPDWKPLLLTEDFLDRNPSCSMQTPTGRLRPASGLCFGSQFLDSGSSRLLQIFPEVMFKRLKNRSSFWLAWLIDICADHADDRQAVFQNDSKGWWEAFFVDHGHLFGGPKGNLRPAPIESLSLDPRIYPDLAPKPALDKLWVNHNVNVDQIWTKNQALPDEWKTKSASDSFARCLTRLASPRKMLEIHTQMVDGLKKRRKLHITSRIDRKLMPQSTFAKIQIAPRDLLAG
jgi:hypothetical protein